MANLIIITGPQAVGKMTVAEKLKEKIGYSLMVNHDSIETALKIFGDNKVGRELNKFIRKKVFELATDENIDMIFTYIIDFSSPNEYEYINSLKSMFEKTGGKLYIVELFADVKTRLERNVTPNRLEKKASKRNIEFSNNDLIESMNKYRLNSNADEKLCEHHIKIDNTNLSPEHVVELVLNEFNELKK